MMIVWDPKKNRPAYKVDKDGTKFDMAGNKLVEKTAEKETEKPAKQAIKPKA
jgi:hypothetical protein